MLEVRTVRAKRQLGGVGPLAGEVAGKPRAGPLEHGVARRLDAPLEKPPVAGLPVDGARHDRARLGRHGNVAKRRLDM